MRSRTSIFDQFFGTKIHFATYNEQYVEPNTKVLNNKWARVRRKHAPEMRYHGTSNPRKNCLCLQTVCGVFRTQYISVFQLAHLFD